MSLVYISHQRHKIENMADLREYLQLATTEKKVQEFAKTRNGPAEFTFRAFKMLHGLIRTGVRDGRPFELYYLFTGGLTGQDTKIEFPPSFGGIMTLVKTLQSAKQVLPWDFLRCLSASKLFRIDDTALCFALCTTFQCRAKGDIGGRTVRNGRLNEAALLVGCPNWAALASHYLFFDTKSMVMTLYTKASRVEPHHRFSIMGVSRPQFNMRNLASFEEKDRVSAAFTMPADRSKACESAVRVAVRLFGSLQVEFRHCLNDVMRDSLTVPDRIGRILARIEVTLKKAFPLHKKLILPPQGRLSVTALPEYLQLYIAGRLGIDAKLLAGSVDSWTPAVKKRLAKTISKKELIKHELDVNNLTRENRTVQDGGAPAYSVRVSSLKKKDERLLYIYGNLTYESLTERPSLDETRRYGLSDTTRSFAFVRRHGFSLSPWVDAALDPEMHDLYGIHTCQPTTDNPAWYTTRLTPIEFSAVLYMRRHEQRRHEQGETPIDDRITSEPATLYILAEGEPSLNRLESEMVFALCPTADMRPGTECIIDPTIRFSPPSG